mgnify:CR=1 FL=1
MKQLRDQLSDHDPVSAPERVVSGMSTDQVLEYLSVHARRAEEEGRYKEMIAMDAAALDKVLRAGVGRTTRVLVPCPAEWRWMAQGEASPWFPGCAVYRQSAQGDWARFFGGSKDYLG